jgi:hypothetical protein
VRVLPETIDFTLITNMAGIGALGFTTIGALLRYDHNSWIAIAADEVPRDPVVRRAHPVGARTHGASPDRVVEFLPYDPSSRIGFRQTAPKPHR